MTQQINAAKSGDQRAFTFLWDFYWNGVYSFMLNRTNKKYLAKEITSETLSRAFIGINTYKSEYEFKTWLCAIAKNVHFDLFNKKAPIYFEITESYFSIADSAPSPEDQLINSENQAQLMKLVNQLNPGLQAVYKLRNQGMSYKDIAINTGNSMSNVKTKLRRVKAQLSVFA